MRQIVAVRRTIYRLFEAVAITFFLIMLMSSLVQVFCRYVLNEPLMWTEELARLMAVGTTYFGGVVVLIAREHIRVDVIETLVGPRTMAVIAIFADVLIALFLAALAWGCVLMVSATWTTYTATMDWFRMGYVYGAVAFAVAMMLFIVLLDIVSRLAQLTTGESAEEPA
ncbi:TRAP transporter small permease [Acuticoccus sp. M5D2P5]|uniref:TRAP transporter small permease n=1 Tax=Acuticoccus kalidii TaxID=2910977 RepID=UPI001F216586|nr:TRAP transporter small permease [Acuticoccus kalidii]MCF3933242.1 TRAP transporter small permease [Acuticoccus kalidii]